MEKKNILIAANEKRFVLKIKNILLDFYEVLVAFSREEALQLAQKELPDIIIIGFLEPRGDSFSLHKELRENINTKHIPFLIVDVKPEKHTKKGWRKVEGMQMNAEGYLTQPVTPVELKKEVNRIINLTIQKNIIWSEAFEYTENVLQKHIETWKKNMIQLIGKNRARYCKSKRKNSSYENIKPA